MGQALRRLRIFELWTSICLFDSGFLAANEVELEHYAIISLEKLLLLKERILHDHPHSLD
jgi:hypothetical protein